MTFNFMNNEPLDRFNQWNRQLVGKPKKTSIFSPPRDLRKPMTLDGWFRAQASSSNSHNNLLSVSKERTERTHTHPYKPNSTLSDTSISQIASSLQFAPDTAQNCELRLRQSEYSSTANQQILKDSLPLLDDLRPVQLNSQSSVSADLSLFAYPAPPRANFDGMILPTDNYDLSLEAFSASKESTIVMKTEYFSSLPFHEVQFCYFEISIRHSNMHAYLLDAKKTQHRLDTSSNQFKIRTTPGRWYQVSVMLFNAAKGQPEFIKEAIVIFKAIFSHEEMLQLYTNAICYAGNQMRPIDNLYRCKPRSYWDEIFDNHNGIMEPYMKDENGQSGSPINGNLNGLFFSCGLTKKGSAAVVPSVSPFGGWRLLKKISQLIDPALNRFWFADFYCNTYHHYITIVVSEIGSDVDSFCQNFLVPLKIDDNPFFKCVYKKGEKPIFYVNIGDESVDMIPLWIELFYTQSIYLSPHDLDKIQIRGTGSSRAGGLAHNRFCLLCNLYPIPKPLPDRDHAQSPLPESAFDKIQILDGRVGHVLSLDDMNLYRRIMREAKTYYDGIKRSFAHLKRRRLYKSKNHKRKADEKMPRSHNTLGASSKRRKIEKDTTELPVVITLSSDSDSDGEQYSKQEIYKNSCVTPMEHNYDLPVFDSSQPPNEFDTNNDDVEIIEVHRKPAYERASSFESQPTSVQLTIPSSVKAVTNSSGSFTVPAKSSQQLQLNNFKPPAMKELPATSQDNRNISVFAAMWKEAIKSNKEPSTSNSTEFGQPLQKSRNNSQFECVDDSQQQTSIKPQSLTSETHLSNLSALKVFQTQPSQMDIAGNIFRRPTQSTVYGEMRFNNSCKPEIQLLRKLLADPESKQSFPPQSSISQSVKDLQHNADNLPINEEEIKANIVKALTSRW